MSDTLPDSAVDRQAIERRLEDGTADAEEVFALADAIRAEDPAAAMSYFARCAGLAPNWTAPVIALGELFRGAGRTDDALLAFGRAQEMDPSNADLLVKRGNLLNEGRDYAGAIADYAGAAALRPSWYLPELNRGNALAAQGELAAARDAYDLALAKGGPPGIRLRRDLLLPIIPESEATYTAAHESYAVSLEALLAAPPPIENPLTESPASRFYLAYHGRNDVELQRNLAAIYLQSCPGLAWTAPHCRAPTRRPGPRRIAFVSRFLFDHSIGRLCLGLFRGLADRTDCEVVCFETAPPPSDAVRREIADLVSRTETLPADIGAARERIADGAPDLVFFPEIGMDPLTYFLAFSRLAPVQCTTWGHPMTSGIPAVDYFLSCAAAEADGESADALYSERLVPLGGLPFSYVRPPRPEPLGKRADFGLDEGATYYFLAQNLFKVHPDMDAPLRAILEGDPDGKLLLLDGHDPSWSEVLRRRFAATLGEYSARVVFLPRQGHEDYMRLLALCDVSLDSFPFCGGNTTYQALAMGTPVVTYPGAFLRGRLSLAIYKHMGVSDFVAATLEEYTEIAVRLGTDPDWRAASAARIAAADALIFDDPVFLKEAGDFLMTAAAP